MSTSPFSDGLGDFIRLILKDKSYFFATFTPRPEYKNRPALPDLLEHSGTVLKCRIGWQMDEEDPYPGEWAVISAFPDDPLLLGRTWIASGDLTLFMVPPSPNLLHGITTTPSES
jgi:hypothetical protein